VNRGDRSIQTVLVEHQIGLPGSPPQILRFEMPGRVAAGAFTDQEWNNAILEKILDQTLKIDDGAYRIVGFEIDSPKVFETAQGRRSLASVGNQKRAPSCNYKKAPTIFGETAPSSGDGKCIADAICIVNGQLIETTLLCDGNIQGGCPSATVCASDFGGDGVVTTSMRGDL